MKGRSLLPYCHFELEDSDYITANRRNPELRGPKGGTLDPNTRVIEFASVGVHARNRRWVQKRLVWMTAGYPWKSARKLLIKPCSTLVPSLILPFSTSWRPLGAVSRYWHLCFSQSSHETCMAVLEQEIRSLVSSSKTVFCSLDTSVKLGQDTSVKFNNLLKEHPQ